MIELVTAAFHKEVPLRPAMGRAMAILSTLGGNWHGRAIVRSAQKACGSDQAARNQHGLADLRVQAAVRRSLRSGKVERVDALPPPLRPDTSQMVKLPPTPEPELIKVKSPFDQAR